MGEGGSRRLTDEVSVSLFALSFGFALTNDFPTMNGGILVRRQIVLVSPFVFRGVEVAKRREGSE